jgi:hypothetical protein
MTETSATRKAALWVGLVFLLGAALGGLGGYVFAHQKYTVTTAAPTTDAAKRAQKVQELTRVANLTPEQSQQLERERIRAILNAEQRPKFEEFIRKLDEERKRNGQ